MSVFGKQTGRPLGRPENLSGGEVSKLQEDGMGPIGLKCDFSRRSALLIGIVGAVAIFGGNLRRVLAATQTLGQDEIKVTTVTSAQLAKMLRQKDFFFVNVHTPYEGEIKNTDAFIVFDKIADNLDKLPKDKTAKIVLYCRSGRMSEIAARELMLLGYSQVSHLSGGMNDWKKSGYEIIEK
jgi:rhodanese-related sulfurtransferase